ncbi:metallophosphoesterase [Micromonospora sp. WMMA1363]|uniref:metallophosphoesterase n=1 Tax=Micromonospora sp. WMMA1363 TaxID=3053985 RepID=UPI00259CF219|nr:metallophosphoesterase [Micromonospora sp. WMMA1363]MDM4718735.1 metallophosphoesterase [Micromonospora sp. WMMA1363]
MTTSGDQPNVDRRSLLQAALAAPAAAGAATALLGAPAAAEAAPGRVDSDSPRFALAVLPDTQYLFDEDSSDPEPLKATFRYLSRERRDANIVFMTHLGDVTEHGTEHEITLASDAFHRLDGKLPYSVLAGNHDIRGGDDQRGDSVYLRAFGPQRFARMPTFGGASPDGYNSYHVLRAGGRDWLVMALDWRVSDKGLGWALGVLDEHRSLPVILTTHDLAWADAAGEARLSSHGQRLWDRLIRDNDQIFLTLNGHYWPPGRTTLTNAAGNDVQVHITNYQDRYYGGAAMIRLYHFDLARNVIDVETFSPWFLSRDPRKRTPLEAETIELTGPVDRFSMKIDFAARFSGFAPVTPPARVPRSR